MPAQRRRCRDGLEARSSIVESKPRISERTACEIASPAAWETEDRCLRWLGCRDVEQITALPMRTARRPSRSWCRHERRRVSDQLIEATQVIENHFRLRKRLQLLSDGGGFCQVTQQSIANASIRNATQLLFD